MYTGRAHIDSTNVLDEIKAFSRTINFRPFAALWADEPQPMPSQVTKQPDITSDSVTADLLPNPPMTPIPYFAASTQVTSCDSAARMSSNFAPELASTPAPTNTIPPAPVLSSPMAQRFLSFAQSESPRCIPTTPLRFNIVSTSSPHSTVMSPSPQIANDQTSPHLRSTAIPVERNFLGFSPAEVQNYVPLTLNSENLLTKQPTNLNDSPMDPVVMKKTSLHSNIELFDTSATSHHNGTNNLIEINETDVEIIENPSQVPVVVLSDTEISSSEIKIDRINENGKVDRMNFTFIMFR